MSFLHHTITLHLKKAVLLAFGVFMVVGLFAAMPAVTHAATTTWDGGGDGTDWFDGNNWDTNSVPGATEDVVIDITAEVHIGTSTTINSLTMGSSTNPASSTLSFDFEATSTNALTIDDGNFTMLASSTLTHATGSVDGTIEGSIYVDVQTGNFIMNSGSYVNLNETGYIGAASGNVDGEGPGAGRTTSFVLPGGGGSYGGEGGDGLNNEYNYTKSATLGTYGSTTAPYQLGSGGGGGRGSGGGNGGGLFAITVAGDATLNGSIVADGQNGFNSVHGGGAGSGGAVFITTAGAISGTGSITADGGNGGTSGLDGGSGGGGRIAIVYNTGTTSNMSLQAYGGSGLFEETPGAAGTIYTKSGSQTYGDLTVKNNDQTTQAGTVILDNITFDSITVASSGMLVASTSATISYTNLDWASGGIIAERGTINFPSSLTIPSGATLQADRARSFTNLTVDGTLTHSLNTRLEYYDTDLTVTNDFTLNSGGTVDVSERGYTGYGDGGAAGGGPGGGLSTSFLSGSGGGAYGGDGGDGMLVPVYSDYGGSAYGSTTAPYQLGSGGGGSRGGAYGGDGGGLFRIAVTGTTTIDGTVNANGGAGEAGILEGTGGGSGGGVFITAGRLEGTGGTITADGGAGGLTGNDGGNGGGGRIAIVYTTGTSSGIAMTAYGAAGANEITSGAAGTVYTKSGAQTYGDLTINNNDTVADVAETPILDTITFDNITVASSALAVVPSGVTVSYTNLDYTQSGIVTERGTINFPSTYTVPSGGTYRADTPRTFTNLTVDGILSHSANTTTKQYYVDLTVTNDFTLNSGGSVDVDGHGYQGGPKTNYDGYGPGAGKYNNNNDGGGAGHGGGGGDGQAVSTGGTSYGGTAYGSTTAPYELGSGGAGAQSNAVGGDGGGLFIIDVSGNAVLNGTVTADGLDGTGNSFDGSGGGAGGGVFITTGGALSGSGSISANGGNGSTVGLDGGSGGGGRIAIIYNTGTTSNLSLLTAYGGSNAGNSEDGAAGTIYTKGAHQTYGNVLIDNNGTVTTASTTLGDIGTSITVQDLTISGSATLSAPPDTVKVNGNLTLSSGAKAVGNGGTYVLNGSNKKIQGDFTGSSTLSALSVNGSYTIQDNASTTDITINSGGSLIAPALMSLSGNYENNGTFSANSGHVYFNGTCGQTASGTMTGASAFYDLTIDNTCANGTTSRSVNFLNAASSTGTTIVTASSSVGWAANATSSFNNVTWAGGNYYTDPVWLYSSATGTTAYIIVSGTAAINDANIRDLDVCGSPLGGLHATGSVEVSNTSCWTVTAPTVPAGVSVWNASGWTLYDTITIDATKVDDDLTDFPVYVDLADLSSQFWSTTPTGSTTVGTDIRVTNNSNTELPRELVSASSTLQTGELHFKADSISSTTDTVFKIWYNGTTTGDYASADAYGAENVWTNDFFGVWHLEDGDSTAAGFYTDATGNSYDATLTDADGDSLESTGKMGSSFDFNGDADEIRYDVADFYTNTFTVSGWSNPDALTDFSSWFSTDDTTSVDSMQLDFNSSGKYQIRHQEFSLSSGQSNLNMWNYVVVSAGSGVYRIYHDGIERASTTHATNVFMEKWRIGTNRGSNKPFNGEIDEFRISSTTRSSAWVKAEFYNQSTTTDFYTTSVSLTSGSSTLAEHDAGQVSNAFNFQNKTQESFFAFKLTPETRTATVTNLVLTVSGAGNISSTSFSNVFLYRDNDNDAAYDVTDTLVATGTFALSGGEGTLTFPEDFAATASLSENYVAIADWTVIARGEGMKLTLNASDITVTDSAGVETVNGSVSSVHHLRNNKGGGGSSNRVPGEEGVPGDGIVTGGTDDGGEELGGEPNFNPPTATGGPHNEWTNGSNAYTSDGAYASETTADERQSYSVFGYTIPGSDTITGIEVKLEASAVTGTGTIQVALSWDAGTSVTAAKTTPELTNTDAIYSLGGSSDTWGRSWSVSDFSDANFRVRVIGQPSGGNTIQIDAITVRVYHAATGGGSGGGGGAL